jgi:hypothetical protein
MTAGPTGPLAMTPAGTKVTGRQIEIAARASERA